MPFKSLVKLFNYLTYCIFLHVLTNMYFCCTVEYHYLTTKKADNGYHRPSMTVRDRTNVVFQVQACKNALLTLTEYSDEVTSHALEFTIGATGNIVFGLLLKCFVLSGVIHRFHGLE